MKTGPTFSEILQASLRSWDSRRADEFVFSMAIPVEGIDPLNQLPVIALNQQFSFLWDCKPGLCIAASGLCQNFELVGQRRFELAQRFSDETFEQLIDGTIDAPSQARPRVLFAFTFFDQNTQAQRDWESPPAVQAVLPRWQLTNQFGQGWLRLNSVVVNDADIREFVEHLWLMRQKLLESLNVETCYRPQGQLFIKDSQSWKKSYKLALEKGINLVDSGELKKIVLAVKQSISLKYPINPLNILSNLRNTQKGSCRFLWKRCQDEVFFGASPERLLSIKNNQLTIDALAGTARGTDKGDILLKSEKDLREHQLVISSIQKQLRSQGLTSHCSRSTRLAKHGHLIHLHTPIVASIRDQLPLHLADALHPTPAVAGLPRSQSIQWVRALEPFDRGHYAAPIGWIDNSGNTELRVAIRCGYLRDTKLDLMAGAGIVKGSVTEGEIEEVALKLAVLAEQLSLNLDFQEKFTNRRSIT